MNESPLALLFVAFIAFVLRAHELDETKVTLA